MSVQRPQVAGGGGGEGRRDFLENAVGEKNSIINRLGLNKYSSLTSADKEILSSSNLNRSCC